MAKKTKTKGDIAWKEFELTYKASKAREEFEKEFEIKPKRNTW